MTTDTVKSELNKSHAQLSLEVLDSFIDYILEPHYEKKIKNFRLKHRGGTSATLYRDHVLKAKTALCNLRLEVERMPG